MDGGRTGDDEPLTVADVVGPDGTADWLSELSDELGEGADDRVALGEVRGTAVLAAVLAAVVRGGVEVSEDGGAALRVGVVATAVLGLARIGTGRTSRYTLRTAANAAASRRVESRGLRESCLMRCCSVRRCRARWER